mmetsp:Transcript_33200/g.55660  ORF Transcript_33200/g.55660 Transcript_33200/m.55660 type:complete len:234 (+) Transcript_33200:362-1063(+)
MSSTCAHALSILLLCAPCCCYGLRERTQVGLRIWGTFIACPSQSSRLSAFALKSLSKATNCSRIFRINTFAWASALSFAASLSFLESESICTLNSSSSSSTVSRETSLMSITPFMVGPPMIASQPRDNSKSKPCLALPRVQTTLASPVQLFNSVIVNLSSEGGEAIFSLSPTTRALSCSCTHSRHPLSSQVPAVFHNEAPHTNCSLVVRCMAAASSSVSFLGTAGGASPPFSL